MSNVKRYIDVFLSLLGLFFIAPIAVLAYPFLLFLIGSPIIFKQKRVGHNGQTFTLYKLRSMKIRAEGYQDHYMELNEAPWPMFKIADDPRFIRKEIRNLGFKGVDALAVGKFLSHSGLDEIPQLWNVLRGQMSLIGPRPLPVDEALALEKEDPSWFKWRHSVKPGIFSVWALSSQHNKSLSYWKKLEKDTLGLNPKDEIIVMTKVIWRQLKNFIY